MKLIEKILNEENLKMAVKKVKQNKGAPGVDKMSVQVLNRKLYKINLDEKPQINIIKRI